MDRITPKQLEILKLIYSFRFLNRIHLQKFLNHKDHRRINTWLKDLTEKEIINRIFSADFNKRQIPAIYYLATKSKKILQKENDINPDLLKRIYNEKLRSDKFINHSLFIADLYFHFSNALDQEKQSLKFLTPTDLRSIPFLPSPLPDAYLSIKFKKENKRYFLDLLDNKPMFAIRNRVKQYVNYYDDQDWQENTNYPFPKILLICPSIRVQKSLFKFIAKITYEEDSPIKFFLALQEEIQKNGINNQTWHSIEYEDD